LRDERKHAILIDTDAQLFAIDAFHPLKTRPSNPYHFLFLEVRCMSLLSLHAMIIMAVDPVLTAILLKKAF